MKKVRPPDTPEEFIKWVKVRSDVEESGCWSWRMSMHDGSSPQASYRARHILVRRELLKMKRGEISKKMIAWPTCGNPTCVNPDHLTMKSRSARLKGIPKTQAHCKKLAEAARKRSILTQAAVEAMRSDDRPNIAWAEELGICDTVVSQIRLHKTWRDYSNPFSALL